MRKTKLPPRCKVGQYGLFVYLDDLEWCDDEWVCLCAYLGYYDDDDEKLRPVVYWGAPIGDGPPEVLSRSNGYCRQKMYALDSCREFLKKYGIHPRVEISLMDWIVEVTCGDAVEADREAAGRPGPA
jgi:hypothetical protein